MQTSTHTTTDSVTKADLERWFNAWNSHNIEQIADLFADDAIVHQPQNPKPLTKDDVRKFFGALFTTYPDIHFATDGMVIQGMEAASWEVVTGTMKGDFKDPATGNMVPATGRSFTIPGAMRLKYNGQHQLTEVRIYWDRMLLMQQVGLLK